MQVLGFDIEFAPRVTDVTNDTRLLRWARKRKYILVRHDRTADKSTRLELFPEIYRNGGRIIQVSGDSSQDPLIVVGKLLANMDKWCEWFAENDGIVRVGRGDPRYTHAEKLYLKVQGGLAMKVPDARRVKPAKPRSRRKPTTPTSQERLL